MPYKLKVKLGHLLKTKEMHTVGLCYNIQQGVSKILYVIPEVPVP